MAEHGTTAMFQRGCRCDPCREARNAYDRAYRLRRRSSNPPRREGNRGKRAGPLTLALRAGDPDAILAELLKKADPVGECRVWRALRNPNGYPKVQSNGKQMLAHRLVAECVYGPLAGQTVHHKCANRGCIEPTHLQPVSLRDNVAEMHQRRWYEKRITELEAALAQENPGHPLLAGAGV